MWLLAPLAGPAGVLLLRFPLVAVATMLIVLRAGEERAARRFPAKIEPAP